MKSFITLFAVCAMAASAVLAEGTKQVQQCPKKAACKCEACGCDTKAKKAACACEKCECCKKAPKAKAETK